VAEFRELPESHTRKEKMPKPKTDPLLAAVIAKLPPVGDEFSQDAQLAWLRMMAMAMSTVYGGDAVNQMGKVPVSVPSVKRLPPVPGGIHQFLIDKDGFAKRASGERVLPKEVSGPIFDMRGATGDMRGIVWADGSTGLNGADLVIVG